MRGSGPQNLARDNNIGKHTKEHMDTKRLEQIGETFIVSKLLDANILVSKPFFDRMGADLIGFTSIDDKARFCRIQCKYRELKTRTHVQVSEEYVVGSFVIFIYVKCSDKIFFLCFLPNDIKKFFSHSEKGNGSFRLELTKKSITELRNDKSIIFSSKKIDEISKLMRSSSVDAEFKQLVKGIVQNYKDLTKTQREQADLKELLHNIELTTIKKQFLKEKISILKEYRRLMQKHYDLQSKNEKDNV